MHIQIYMNEVAGGWLPDDIDRFLGGSEELIVLLAEALVRYGFRVTVYHNRPLDCGIQQREDVERNEVYYLPRERATLGKDPQNEVLITFKDPSPFIQGASVFRKDWIENKQWDKITDLISLYINSMKRSFK